jgi:hypothetical protein
MKRQETRQVIYIIQVGVPVVRPSSAVSPAIHCHAQVTDHLCERRDFDMACGSTSLWAGETTWFCCGSAWGPCGSTGTGACGTCQSNAHQAAWPNTSAACFDITRPDLCGENIPRRGCGAVMNVRHQCSGATVCVTVSDCGPRTKSFCGEATCCNGSCSTNRVIHLTPSAFSAIGSLSSGKLPVYIYE